MESLIKEGLMIRILVADDHHIVRQGLKQVLDMEPDMEVVGETGSTSGLLSLVNDLSWDVLVLDISLPDRSGLEALREIRAMRPRGVVLILSMHTEEQYVERALSEGAAGYVSKEGTVEEVVEAVREVMGGGTYISPSLAYRLITTVEDE
jgi:two-component system invasion response regulator UvrY